MRPLMKFSAPISSILLLFALRGYGQAVPTAGLSTSYNAGADPTAGPKLSWADGNVHYSLMANEMIQFSFYGQGRNTSTTALAGNVGYVTLSETHPFALLFGGGVLIGQGGQGTSTYQNLAVSQTYIKGRWIFSANDSFSFLPQSPTTGINGIAGIPLGSIPLDGPSGGPAGGVLTYSGNRISNSLSGNVERMLTGKTSISGGGSWMVLHFLDQNAGFDTDSVSAQVGVNHRIDVRNSYSVSGVYSKFKTSGITFSNPAFPQSQITYYTKGVNGSYSRQWTRLIGTTISAGPQWITSSNSQLVPDRLTTYVNANATYSREVGQFALRYTRGANGGSGAFAGAVSDNVSASYSRNLARDWSISTVVSWVKTNGLVQGAPVGLPVGANRTITSEYGTVQLMHGFSRTISAHASYSAQNQDSNSPITAQNVVNGLSHTIGFGVSWSPRSTRFGDF